MQTAPLSLSIVVVAWHGSVALKSCLNSLVNQLPAGNCQVIVASNFEANDLGNLPELLRNFESICLPPEAEVPELRARGAGRATGKIIAFLEDHCRCDAGWCEQMIKAHRSSYSVIGGSVENGQRQQRLSWAVYFYDYGAYMLPSVPQVVPALSGINVSYKREVLETLRDQYAHGFYETFINQELQKRGYDLYLMPTAIVYHDKAYDLKTAVAESYRYGRDFAARRLSGASAFKRLLYVIVSIPLPALLVGRIIRRTVQKKRHLKELAGCLPYLVLLMTAWSYGELRGYLGRP